MGDRKIFCIGLNKTGTISLHQALEMLGYRSLHWGGPETGQIVRRAQAEGRPLVDDLDYDAFSDLAILSKQFPLLDAQYPGSRFILTTRAMEAWVESRAAHVARNLERVATGEYTGNFLTVDRDGWREEFEDHHRRVAEYFTGRDDLLVMDITAGDGWEVLCPFLGHDVPDDPWPWRNRLATGRPAREGDEARDAAGDAGDAPITP